MPFFILYCILLKNDSLLWILRFPGYFETPLFRTFFHFPWDFEIAGFDCSPFFPQDSSSTIIMQVCVGIGTNKERFYLYTMVAHGGHATYSFISRDKKTVYRTIIYRAINRKYRTINWELLRDDNSQFIAPYFRFITR